MILDASDLNFLTWLITFQNKHGWKATFYIRSLHKELYLYTRSIF